MTFIIYRIKYKKQKEKVFVKNRNSYFKKPHSRPFV